jgi:hypothetical protein
MYKLLKDYNNLIYAVANNNTTIPFVPANTDYQTFKRDIAEGVELQDPDGNVMSAEDVAAFLKSLAEA